MLAADTGLNLQNDTLDCLMSDDATSTLLVIKGGVLLFAYDLAVDAPGAPEQLKWTYMLQVGTAPWIDLPLCAAHIRCCPCDGKTLACMSSIISHHCRHRFCWWDDCQPRDVNQQGHI